MDPGEVVRELFERMEARDWESAAQLLSPTVQIEFTETGERFDGENFLTMNRAYPEGWSIDVIETVVEVERVATQVRVVHGDEIFWCAGFYSVTDGVVASGVEHWVTERSEPPPEWRAQFAS